MKTFPAQIFIFFIIISIVFAIPPPDCTCELTYCGFPSCEQWWWLYDRECDPYCVINRVEEDKKETEVARTDTLKDCNCGKFPKDILLQPSSPNTQYRVHCKDNDWGITGDDLVGNFYLNVDEIKVSSGTVKETKKFLSNCSKKDAYVIFRCTSSGRSAQVEVTQ